MSFDVLQDKIRTMKNPTVVGLDPKPEYVPPQIRRDCYCLLYTSPHSAEEKARPLAEAPSGMVGLETALAVTLTELYHTGEMGLSKTFGAGRFTGRWRKAAFSRRF